MPSPTCRPQLVTPAPPQYFMYRISLAPALGRQPEIARSVLRYSDQCRVSELARPCVHRVEARDLGARELPREGEKKEMIELYVEEGMTVEDATPIVNAFAKCECALPSILSRICFVSGYCAACM